MKTFSASPFSPLAKLGFLGIFLIALPCQALWLYETQTWTLEDGLGLPSNTDYVGNDAIDFNDFLVFPDSDPYLPYFRRVEIEIVTWYEVDGTVTNNDAGTATVDVSLFKQADPPVPQTQVRLEDGVPQQVFEFDDAAFETLDQLVIGAGPSETVNYSLQTEQVGATQVYLQPATGAFVGVSGSPLAYTLELYRHIFQATELDSKSINSTESGTVFATVQLRYYVPEPSAGLLLGLGLLTFTRRRSRRR